MKAVSPFVEAIDALDIAISDKSFYGYGPLPIPHELDAIPEKLIRSYEKAEERNSELLLTLGRDAASVLLAYSERQATLAVRARSQDILKLSIFAVGLATVIADDEREGILVMPLPWRSAELLKSKPKDVFLTLAETLPPVGRNALIAFARRKPEDQTLTCMGYTEGNDKDGFRYIRTW